MADLPQPVLVYTRVRANRRNTVLLLGLLGLLLLPFALGVTQYLMPWLAIVILPVLLGDQVLYSDRPLLGMAAIVFGTLAIVIAAAALAYRHAARLVLRSAGARPVAADAGQDLTRAVENLCIGAGLPPPHVYVVESSAANACATGRTPADAALVVTRGLLSLLNRRELEGVIAHELSHIGNHDIRVGTTLAGVGGVLGLPAGLVARAFRLLFRIEWALGAGCLLWSLLLFLSFLGMTFGLVRNFPAEFPRELYWWSLAAAASPLYVLFGAPLAWLLIRTAIWRQRELLADADAALLTRDPEGLALALAKVGATGGGRLGASGATAHLYIVDPLAPQAPWWDRIFPCHPPIEERIALLARMGSGEIAPAALQAAAEAGAALQQTVQAEAAQRANVIEDVPQEIESYFRLTGPLTPLYAAPDVASTIRGQLPAETRVAFLGIAGSFLRVATADSGVGYVSIAAPKAWD